MRTTQTRSHFNLLLGFNIFAFNLRNLYYRRYIKVIIIIIIFIIIIIISQFVSRHMVVTSEAVSPNPRASKEQQDTEMAKGNKK